MRELTYEMLLQITQCMKNVESVYSEGDIGVLTMNVTFSEQVAQKNKKGNRLPRLIRKTCILQFMRKYLNHSLLARQTTFAMR